MFGRKKLAMIVAEFLGSAILTSVVLAVSKSAVGLPYFVAIAAGVTFGVLPLIIGGMSGAHINPVVTVGLWTVRKIQTLEAVVYIAAQFLGAVVALRLYVYLVDQSIKNTANKNFDWRVLVAEMVGTFIFTFGVASAIYQGMKGLRLAVTVGTSLFLGMVVAAVASNGLVNPALALGVQSWNKEYVIGPIVGALVGVNLYAILFEGPSVRLWTTSKAAASRPAVASKPVVKPATKARAKKPATRRKR
ncbi:MAG: major intrinsic protein [Candidatus Saccharibacteria bacterium]|nr:major intrinsic protein [Candidatus Saccharibacteria bacterium]